MTKSFKLYTNCEIPAIGYGTWRIPPEQIKELIAYAVDEVGYRHIDCAHVYGNEKQIGDALQLLKTPRKQLFITSKLWNTYHRPENVRKGFDKTLKDLNLDYLDLYLMHWPTAFQPGEDFSPKCPNGRYLIDKVDYLETYREMESLVDLGLVKNLGVSNFTIKKLQRILESCKIKPSVVQVEKHPFLIQSELYEFCERHNIHITAYSPLGSSDTNKLNLLNNETIIEIATKYKIKPATLLISWSIKSSSVIPRSSNKENIKSNITTIEINEDDIEEINRLNRGERCFKGFDNDFSD